MCAMWQVIWEGYYYTDHIKKRKVLRITYSATQNGRSMCVIAFFFFIFFFCLISFLTPSSLWGSKAIALFRLCWCKGLQKALIKRWKGIKSRYNLLSLIRLRSIENFCYLLHNFPQFGIATYSAKISYGKQKCGLIKVYFLTFPACF